MQDKAISKLIGKDFFDMFNPLITGRLENYNVKV